MSDPISLTSSSSPRLQSIDALRGFDMFWIIRGDTMTKSLAIWLGFPKLAAQFEHVKWSGFHFYDLIFPLFLFIVGVVIPFSLSKHTDGSLRKASYRSAYQRIVARTILLMFLGLVGSGLLEFDFSNFRWPGVLQRTGICYFVAAVAVLHLNTTKQALLFAVLIFGYWCLLSTISAPGFEPFNLTMEGSLPGYVDRRLIPGKLYYGFGDNEGILSTFPAIATTLLGVFAGHWLRSAQTPAIKVLGLYVAAATCLATGYLWSFTFPLNKILWTSSFVLVTGGWSYGLLATFYLLIDVLGYRRWSFFFVVIGMNAITIYVLQEFVDFSQISRFFLGGIIASVGTACASSFGPTEVAAMQKAILMFGVLTLKWLLLWYLYRNKTFLKV